MRVREARAGDENAIGRVHERSVRGLAAEYYDDAVLEAWVTPPEDEEPAAEAGSDEKGGGEDARDEDEGHEDDVQPENGRLFVADVEDDADSSSPTVAGFGDVRFDPPEYLDEPADGGVRAVYVAPEYAGEGVGSALLERLETEARDRNLERLGLLASVNARGFYEHHGYEVVEETTFRFGEDVEGPAVEMHKQL